MIRRFDASRRAGLLATAARAGSDARPAAVYANKTKSAQVDGFDNAARR
jgi:hypothetical protein